MSGRSWAGLGLLLLAAFLVRLGGAVWWQNRLASPQEFFFPDSDSYWHLARTIGLGQPYQYGSPDARVFRTPGYPAVLAVVFWLGGPEVPVLWGRVLGAGLGVACVGCCWWLGRRLFGPRAGWLAGLAAALYPEAVAASIFILSEAAFCPVLCFQLVMLLQTWQAEDLRKTIGYSLAAGLLGGLGTLVRPSWFWFTPLTAVLGVVCAGKIFDGGKSAAGQPTEGEVRLEPSPPRSRSPRGIVRLAMAGAMLAGMIVVLLPWWIRNYRVVGRFTPTTLQVGATLYDGLHPAASGKSDMRFVEEFAQSERWLLNYRGPEVRILDPERWNRGKKSAEPVEKVSDRGVPEPEGPTVIWEYWLDRAMAEEALRWAWGHPKEVMRLAWAKLRRMWTPWPNEPALSASPLAAVVGGSYLPVLLAGLLGLVHAGRRGGLLVVVLLVLPSLYLSLVHSILVGSVRYRGPAMFGWIVLGAGWLTEKFRPIEPRLDLLGKGAA